MKLTGTRTTPSRAVANESTANCQQLCDSSASRSPLPRPSAARAAAVRDTAASSSANVSRVSPHTRASLPGTRDAVRCSISLMPCRRASPTSTPPMSSATMPHLLPLLTSTVHTPSAPWAEAKVTPPARPDDIRQARTPLRSGARSTVRPTLSSSPAASPERSSGEGSRPPFRMLDCKAAAPWTASRRPSHEPVTCLRSRLAASARGGCRRRQAVGTASTHARTTSTSRRAQRADHPTRARPFGMLRRPPAVHQAVIGREPSSRVDHVL